MLSPEQIEHVRPTLTKLQIVAAAMLAGVVFLTAVVFFLNRDRPLSYDLNMLPLMGAVTSMFVYVLALFLPPVFASAVPRRDVQSSLQQSNDLRKADAAANLLFNSQLIRSALLEAGAMLNAVVFLIDGNAMSLIAVGLGLFLMMVTFPLKGRMLTWLDERVSS